MASGNPIATFEPQDFVPSASNGAAFKSKNNQGVWEFDPTTNQSVESTFEVVNYSGHGVGTGWTVVLTVAADTATTGNMGWTVAFQRLNAGATAYTTDSFSTAVVSSNDNVQGTTGSPTVTTIAVTDGAQINNADNGDHMRIKIFRNATADSAAGLGDLLGVRIKET